MINRMSKGGKLFKLFKMRAPEPDLRLFRSLSQFRNYFMGNASKIQFIDFISEDFQPVESCQRSFLSRHLFVSSLSDDRVLNKWKGGRRHERSTRLHRPLTQIRRPKHLPNPSIRRNQIFSTSMFFPSFNSCQGSYLRMMRRLVFSSCFLNFFLSEFQFFSLHCHSPTSLTTLRI